MPRLPVTAPLLLACVMLASGVLRAQLVPGTIASGNAEFTFFAYPTSNTSTAGTAALRTAGPTSTNHLYHTWWWWRLNGDPREYAFHNGLANQLAPSSVFAGDRAVLSWPNVDNRGLAARLELRLIAADATSAVLVQKMTVTNNTGGPITLNLFGYHDLNQCGLFNNAAESPRTNLQIVTDFMCGTVGQVFAPGASHYEVASFPLVRLRLVDPVADVLNDSGLPYSPGDYTGAFQWQDVVVAPSASYSAYMLISEDFALTACARVASTSRFGAAKPGSNGLPVWNTGVLPMPGLPVTLEITNGAAGFPPQIYLGGAPTSIYLPPFDITMLIDVSQPYISFFGSTFDATNRSTTSFVLPRVSTLCGATLFIQAFYVDPVATFGVGHTDGLRWNIGSLF